MKFTHKQILAYTIFLFFFQINALSLIVGDNASNCVKAPLKAVLTPAMARQFNRVHGFQSKRRLQIDKDVGRLQWLVYLFM